MNGNRLTKKELYRAAQQVEAAMLAALPEPTEAENTFSPAFEGKMAPLLRRARKRVRLRRILQTAAALFLALLAGATIYLAAFPEARAAVVSWVKESYIGRTIFRFSGEENVGGLPHYRPTWLPEGFELAEEVENGHVCIEVYNNETSAERLILSWRTMTDASQLSIMGIGKSYEKRIVSINGMYGELSICTSGDDSNYLYWINEADNTLTYIESTQDENVILHIAESVILDNSTK